MIRAEPNYAALADAMEELELQVAVANATKKDMIGKLRDDHGKRVADAFKAAMKIRRMDAEKRAEQDEVDAEAFRILALLEKPRAPRATPAREIIEHFDPETGESSEPDNSGGVHGREAAHPATNPVAKASVDNAITSPAMGADGSGDVSRLSAGSGTGAPTPSRPVGILRPHCQDRSNCGSGTRDHCWSCKKIIAAREMVAA